MHINDLIITCIIVFKCISLKIYSKSCILTHCCLTRMMFKQRKMYILQIYEITHREVLIELMRKSSSASDKMCTFTLHMSDNFFYTSISKFSLLQILS